MLFLIVSGASSHADELRVVTTIKPVHALAAQVLADIAEPRLLIDGAQSPHVFALKPSDAAALNRAHLFVRISPTLEPFSEKIRTSLPKSVEVLSLIDASGLTVLPLRESGSFERHDHDHEKDHHDHKGHDESDTGHDTDHHDHSRDDAHIWLDPDNAVQMIRALVKSLSAIAPEHKAKLEQNGDAAVARLQKLALDLTARLKPATTKPYIVFHDAFQYFEKRFGLTAAGAITLHPDVPLSGKRLQEIRKKIKQAGVTCVFSEPQFNAKRLSAVVEGSKAKTGALDPLGYGVPKGPNAYGTMMRKLADGFLGCLTR